MTTTSDSVTIPDLRTRIEAALDEIRPAIHQDGGDVELAEIEGSTARVAMTGHCDGCPISHVTLKLGIERLIKERCPEIENVESVGGFVFGFDEPTWDYRRSETEDGFAYPTESPAAKMLDERDGPT
jgi:Fe-S cluster biogenesis protein NfuA